MTATEQVAGGREAIEAAKAEVARLESAILDGDESITAAQLAEATAEVTRRELRLEGLMSRSARELEAERLDAIEGIRADLLGQFGGDAADEMLDRYAQAVQALSAFAGTVNRHNALVDDACRRLVDLAPLPPDLNPGTDGGQIRTGDVNVTQLDLARMLTEAAWQAATEAGSPDAPVGALATSAGIVTAGKHEADAYGCATGHRYGPVGQLRLERDRARRAPVA